MTIVHRKLICTECKWSFEETRVNRSYSCPNCGFEGQIVGHVANDMIFCNDCYAFGCAANWCKCTCHKEIQRA